MYRFFPLRFAKPRHFKFDPKALGSKAAEPFHGAVRAVCGLSRKDKLGESLMSSLPCELSFNELRDCARRASKKERTIPANLHAAACRSVYKKPSGCQTLELEPQDWSRPLPFGSDAALKTSVHSAVRTPDVKLGVNCAGLTKNKNNKWLTKPHVLVQRFDLVNKLSKLWSSTAGSQEEKADRIHKQVKCLWLSRLVSPHVFIKVAGVDVPEDTRLLVISSGPHSVKTLKLKSFAGSDGFEIASKSFANGCQDFFLPDLESVQVQDVQIKVATNDM